MFVGYNSCCGKHGICSISCCTAEIMDLHKIARVSRYHSAMCNVLWQYINLQYCCLSLPSPPLSKRRRYCVAWHVCVCVWHCVCAEPRLHAALVLAARGMHCIQCFVVSVWNGSELYFALFCFIHYFDLSNCSPLGNVNCIALGKQYHWIGWNRHVGISMYYYHSYFC